MRANWFDRSIEFFAPVWAAERAAARLALETARGYAAAKPGRRTDGWRASGASANSEIGTAAKRLRDRAREQVRNNPYAASAVSKLAAKTVGAGIVPRLAAPRAEVERKQAAMALWNAFVENSDPEGQIDFYGQQDLAARTLFETGECLIRFVPRPASWKLKVPLQIQVLEGDYLDSAKTESLKDGGLIVQGVEYDPEGRRVAYWMFDEHPGDALTSFVKRGFASRRVPASEVRHVFRPLRPGQARGVSPFAPVLLRLRDIDDYADAELMRKKVAACFAAFVKKSGGAAASPLASPGDVSKDKDKDRRIERLGPGRIDYMEAGEDIVFSEPPAGAGYVEFMRHELHAIAAGVGITYGQLTGDLSQANYSSMRAGLVDFWDLLDQWQWHVLIPQMCRPVWNRVGALAVVTGARPRDTSWDAIWTPPRRRWVDPAKEVSAARDEVRMGLVSLRAKIAETGEDPDEVLAEIADTNKALDADGIVLDSDPRKIARGGSAQSVAEPVLGADPEANPNPNQE